MIQENFDEDCCDIDGVTKLGKFQVGREETVWFKSNRSYRFNPSSGPTINFDDEYFMIAVDPTRFLFFDSRTFDYNLERQRSSCMFCMNRKKIDLDTEELVQVAHVEMPYGHIGYNSVFDKWLNDSREYNPKDSWNSIGPDCLSDIYVAYSKLGYETEAVIHSL